MCARGCANQFVQHLVSLLLASAGAMFHPQFSAPFGPWHINQGRSNLAKTPKNVQKIFSEQVVLMVHTSPYSAYELPQREMLQGRKYRRKIQSRGIRMPKQLEKVIASESAKARKQAPPPQFNCCSAEARQRFNCGKARGRGRLAQGGLREAGQE